MQKSPCGSVLFCVLLAPIAEAGPHAPPVIAVNLARASNAYTLDLEGDRISFLVGEAQQGVDLNGDGDLQDQVVHLFDPGGVGLVNLGLAAQFAALSRDRMVFFVDEWGQQTDLNGDGDLYDAVLHDLDLVSYNLRNLGLCGYVVGRSGDGWLPFEVPENGTDLNGDGDGTDFVLHVQGIGAGTTQNLGLVLAGSILGPSLGVGGSLVALAASEAGQGADLNGDGDQSDAVLHLYDLSTGVTSNLGLALDLYLDGLPLVAAGKILVGVSEADQGNLDRNGDGDTLDAVAQVVDAASLTSLNLGLALSYANHPVVITDAGTAFLVSEAHQGGTDLDGNGSANDEVVHVHRFAPAATTNLSLAPSWGELRASQGRVVFLGDSKLRIHQIQAGTTASLGSVDAAQVEVGGDLVVYRKAGRLRAHDAALDRTFDLGLVGQPEEVVDGRCSYRVAETSIDLNDDGDTDDEVLHLFDLATGTTNNLRLAFTGAIREGNLMALLVDERHQGNSDRNGDLDASDSVLAAVRIVPERCGSLEPYGSGCTGAAPSIPELLIQGCPQPGWSGTPLALQVTGGAPLANAFLLLGTQRNNLPISPGCTLLVGPFPPILLGPLPLDLQGTLSFTALIPAAAQPGTLTLQAFVLNGIPGGSSSTSGIEIAVP